MKSVRIPSYSGPYFAASGLNTEKYRNISQNLVRIRENTDQNNSEYGHFLRSAKWLSIRLKTKKLWVLTLFHLHQRNAAHQRSSENMQQIYRRTPMRILLAFIIKFCCSYPSILLLTIPSLYPWMFR